MYLWHIFLIRPFAAISIAICLATIAFLFRVSKRRSENKADRFLIGFLGMMSVYEGLRILQEAGIVMRATSTLDDTLELLIVCCYLLAALVLRLSNVNHLDAASILRLVQAAPPRSPHRSGESPLELFRQKEDANTLETLHWAIPRLSDGAFKLYALLCLRVDHTTGRIPLGVSDVRLTLEKKKEELEAYLIELEAAGAVSLRRNGASVNIEIIARNRQISGAAPEKFVRPSVAYAGPQAS